MHQRGDDDVGEREREKANREGEFIFRTMKMQVGKALSFILFIYLFSFFPGRLRSGPHGVNHPWQDVDLVEHLPQSHPAALLPLLSKLSSCAAGLFIYLSIPRSPDSRLLLSLPRSPLSSEEEGYRRIENSVDR